MAAAASSWSRTLVLRHGQTPSSLSLFSLLILT
ncbi:hypothetical protein J2S92_002200 [Arthrobacter bambusae]|nr:hypothetical protein [Arthrobacter bambusae]MDQ0235732.1 hypothetical protein [Arthrobacter bambusae]